MKTLAQIFGTTQLKLGKFTWMFSCINRCYLPSVRFSQESSAKLTNQRASDAFTSSQFSIHVRHILRTSKFQHSYFTIFYISEQYVWKLWVWIQFTGLTLPLSGTPVNNPITLISPVYRGWAPFFAADSLCVALQISKQFSPKARTPTHWMPSSDQILTQNDHSRSFKVIRFGVSEEPLRGYIVQYNNCGHKCEGSEDIASERSENHHLRRPHTHLKSPLQQTPANIHINLTLLETRFSGLQFCCWQCIGSSSNFRTVLSESQKRQLISCRARNRF